MNDLKTLISSLRHRVETGTFDAATVHKATADLAASGYQYDSALFPALSADHPWPIPGLASPESLAEALLWKMGKWKIYKSFVAHYADAKSTPKKTDVVFYAFAKHLGDTTNPIYDQHALRAMWAIDSQLTPLQASVCRKLLANGDGSWKPIASGLKAEDGYRLYKERLAELCKGGASLREIDTLLMPLGQALKKTTGVDEFFQITGCSK